MPTYSESKAKLSASMSELAHKAREAEQTTVAAASDAQDKLEVRVAAARATVAQRREDLKERSAGVHDDLSSMWTGLRGHVHEQFEKIRSKIDEKRDDHDGKVSERRAERLERHAAHAVDFAVYAIAEAALAVIEAVEARTIADALAPDNPPD